MLLLGSQNGKLLVSACVQTSCHNTAFFFSSCCASPVASVATHEVVFAIKQDNLDELEHEQVPLRPAKIPERPSEEELRRHNLTHLPYASWCPHCVAGRGVDDKHEKKSEESKKKVKPVVQFDFMFLRSEKDKKRENLLNIV